MTVTPLGDLLELLHGAGTHHRTLRAEVRHWTHSERSRRALERHKSRGSTLTFFGVGEEGPPVEEHEELIRLWFSPPRAREEIESFDGPDRATSLRVVDGARRWSYDSWSGSITSAGDPSAVLPVGQTALALLEPASFIGSVDFELLGPARVAGREGIRAVATPRPRGDDDLPLLQLPWGADRYELVADRERGVLLRLVALIDDEPFWLTEMTELAFDEELAPELFDFTPPDGGPVREADTAPELECLPLHEAARKAGFRVFVPTVLPESAIPEVSLLGACSSETEAPEVYLSYADSAWSLEIEQRPSGTADPGWSERRSGPRTYRAAQIHTQAQLLAELEGTLIVMTGQGLDVGMLVRAADSLEPAPTNPPW